MSLSSQKFVAAILDDKTDGVLRGKAEIARFLEQGARSRPIGLVRWHRAATWFSAGGTLVWENPRATPDGEQVEIVEVMDIADGLIRHHRIYWGVDGLCTDCTDIGAPRRARLIVTETCVAPAGRRVAA